MLNDSWLTFKYIKGSCRIQMLGSQLPLDVVGDFTFSQDRESIFTSVDKIIDIVEGSLLRSQHEDGTNFSLLSQSSSQIKRQTWRVEAAQNLAIKRNNPSSIPSQIFCCCPYQTFCHY